MSGFWRERPYLISYVFLIVITVAGFLSIKDTQDDLNEAARSRSEVACLALNEQRLLLKDVLITASPPERRSSESQEFFDRVEPLLAPVPCDEFIKNPDMFLRQFDEKGRR